MKKTFIVLCSTALLFWGGDTVVGSQSEVPWYNPDAVVVPMSGTVVDEEGSPVAGVRVFETRTGEQRSVRTDENGNFTFPRGDRTDRLLAENADHSLIGIWEETLWRTGQPNEDTTIVLKPARSITGVVIDGTGQPIPDVQIIATAYHSEVVRTQTDANGEFRFLYPVDIPLEAILALKDGAGFDYVWTLETPSDEERRTFGRDGDPDARKKSDGRFTLTLDGANPVRFRFVDDDGQPLEGVEIHPWVFRNPNQPGDLNVAISPYRKTSDADGNVAFDFFPIWQDISVTFWAEKNGFLRQRIDLQPEQFEQDNAIRMRPAVALRGTLRFPDGTPAQQWTVFAQGDGGGFDAFLTRQTTDNQGRYEVMAIPHRTVHLNAEQPRGLAVQTIDRDWVAIPQLNIDVGSDPIFVRDFTLERGTRITGIATAGPDNEPVANASIIIHPQEKNEDATEGESAFRNLRSWWWERTGADGVFEFWIAPGHYEMQLQRGAWNRQPRAQITVEQGIEQTVNLHIEGEIATAAIQAPRRIRGRAIFLDSPDAIASGALISFVSFDLQSGNLTADENGEFTIMARNEPVYVQAMTPEGVFGRMMIVQPTEEEFTISLDLTATIHGTVIDRRSTEPPVGRLVTFSINVSSSESERSGFLPSFQREVQTSERGDFVLQHIPTGVAGDVMFTTFHYGEEVSRGSSFIARNLELRPAEYRALDNYRFDSRPHGDHEFFHQVYNANAHTRFMMRGRNPYEGRFDELRERAQRNNKGVFVILVRDKVDTADLEPLRSIYVTLFRDDDMFAQTERFYMMCILMHPMEIMRRNFVAADSQDFIRERGITDPLPSLFSFAFFDTDGTLRGVEAFDHTTSPTQQKTDLIEMLGRY